MAADARVQISARPVPQEPMVRFAVHSSLKLLLISFVRLSQYLIINLGMSENFGGVDFDHLSFPATMRVDWIRVYQPLHDINIGCDPVDFPTQDYINTYVE